MNETREEQLINAGKAAEADKKVDVEALKKKYAASEEKVYTVVTTVQVDDETEDEFTFLFKKPKAASYDRYVKTMSNSVTKASKSFAFDNIIDEQRDMLKETVEEYPAITISLTVSIKAFMMICLTLSLVRCSLPELQQQLRTTRHPAPRWQVRYRHLEPQLQMPMSHLRSSLP